ncbi:MAG: phosphatase PAP2 family protein [Candidatus Cloacimonetes bacterium]|nr:phosphatase PAP2 family protein [Candidatus Cloacimonadota bacterium]
MKIRKILLIILALSFFVLPLMAETESFDFKEYLLSYPKIVMDAPQFYLKEKPELIASFALGTLALYTLDYPITETAMKLNDEGKLNDVYSIVGGFGEAKYVFPALGVTALGAHLFDADELLDISMVSLKSAVLSSAATYTIKTIAQRGRPLESIDKKFLGLDFDLGGDNKSFPSGHSTLVWSIAPILAAHYPDSAWVKYLVYSLAGAVSFSRVAQGEHWASDVFAGAVIGYSTAQLCLKDKAQIRLIISEYGSIVAGFSSSF